MFTTLKDLGAHFGPERCEGTPVKPTMPGFLASLEGNSGHITLPDGSVAYTHQIVTPGYGTDEPDEIAEYVRAIEEWQDENARLRSMLARVLVPEEWEKGLREEIEAELAEPPEEQRRV